MASWMGPNCTMWPPMGPHNYVYLLLFAHVLLLTRWVAGLAMCSYCGAVDGWPVLGLLWSVVIAEHLACGPELMRVLADGIVRGPPGECAYPAPKSWEQCCPLSGQYWKKWPNSWGHFVIRNLITLGIKGCYIPGAILFQKLLLQGK